MAYRMTFSICLISLLACCLATIGCGKNAGTGDISGVWKGDKCNCSVTINMAGEHKTITLGEKKIEITSQAEKEDIVSLGVKKDNGETAVWTFQKIWDDNGSTFTLVFSNDKDQENLTLMKKLS